MKKYIQPKIKAIQLNEDQAVLQVCKSGGKYFSGGTHCLYQTRVAPPSTCATFVKGGYSVGFNVFEAQNIPS
ncbi:MAG: hypothetical protein PHQ52_03625 [Candidatus Omnitrophica bacterium]|nr:hypothetical protein [Candidatus Omnitrophota bacterium]